MLPQEARQSLSLEHLTEFPLENGVNKTRDINFLGLGTIIIWYGTKNY